MRAIVLVLLLAACSPRDIVGSAPFPSDLSDPAATKTPEGALAAYHGTLVRFRIAVGDRFSGYVPVSGLLTDELRDRNQLGLAYAATPGPDVRDFPDPATSGPDVTLYSYLQKVRGQGYQAVGLLRDFAPETSPALRGHLYAVMGYAETMLAELYCSGIPLSTLDYDGDYTLAPGSSTAEVLTHAQALFDTALTLAGDSARILNLARVGRARALLALGDYAGAAAAVADVPTTFQYAVTYAIASPGETQGVNFGYRLLPFSWEYSMSDQEGVNGLPYRSSNDPRTLSTPGGTNDNGATIYQSAKYASDGLSPIVLADGIEARLIEAEAELNGAAGGDWLATLNALRTDGTFDTQPSDTNPAVTDTLWHAGTGGVAGLAPLADPGTPNARVDLVFRERAFWLFLTGHRQGDLRRLIRQYGRNASQVYPIGPYNLGTSYGTDITAPIPESERTNNPLFTGCQSRGA
ncbi:MAG: hypothetical protein IRY91_05230 [Gemmatimonadaceae bacterium]|nr:hypothetical protein [Gemmatimonadaceae bacterium]